MSYGADHRKNKAAHAVCFYVAHTVNSGFGWVLVDTEGFDGFPPEVKAWEERIGERVLYPLVVLAMFVAGLPIPEHDGE